MTFGRPKTEFPAGGLGPQFVFAVAANKRELHSSRCSKSIQRPRILPFIVSKGIIISIISDNAEIHRIKRVPLAVEFLYVKIPTANAES
jgi:hypothetical protein